MFDPSVGSAFRGWTVGKSVLALLVVLAATPSAAVTVVGAGRAALAWAPSEGPVAGYIVLGSRNGGPETTQGYTDAQQFSVEGAPGDRLVIRIRAYGFSGPGGSLALGPPSDPSPQIQFEAAPVWPTSDVLALHCGGCAKVRLALLGAPQLRYEFPTLSAPWEPIGVGRITSGGAPELAWRNAQTGQIAITPIGPGAESALSVSSTSGMPSRMALGLADLDGDGRKEILLRNSSSGYVERWSPHGSILIPLSANPVPSSWVFGTANDLDGDGRDELLWRGDAPGELRVTGWSGGNPLASLDRFDLAASGVPVQSADFDGNGWADVLVRDANGLLSVAYFDGRGLAREVALTLPLTTTFFWLPSRAWADLDGRSGAELVVQSQITGALFGVWPTTDSTPPTAKLFDVDGAWRPVGRVE